MCIVWSQFIEFSLCKCPVMKYLAKEQFLEGADGVIHHTNALPRNAAF